MEGNIHTIDEVTRGEIGDEFRHINWMVGDRCTIFLHPLHEGMHPDDLFDDRNNVREIVTIDRHSNNPTWVVGFTMKDPETGEEEYVREGAVRSFVYPEGHVF